MKSKLFGVNIRTSCKYCNNYYIENELSYCSKGRQIKNDKCRKFDYDPLMRVPKGNIFIKKYSEDDFKL